MAIVPFFNHTSDIPVLVISTSETYLDYQARGGYFDCIVDSHWSLYAYDPERFCTIRIFIGFDA